MVSTSSLALPWDAKTGVHGDKAGGGGSEAGEEIFGRRRPSCHVEDPRDFVATLEVKCEGAGAVFADYDEGRALRVRSIQVGGPVFWHNQRAPADEKISLGDIITSVCGVTGRADVMRKALDCIGEMEVVVRRPKTISIDSLAKGSKPWGLQLSRQSRASALLVRSVLDSGAVAEWNEAAPDGARICAGDCIMSVNGASGDVDALHELICSSDRLDLVVLRTSS